MMERICPYEHYYSHQAGSGVGIVYKGAPLQRGHGIGGFLGGIIRSVLPLLSSGVKTVGKEFLNAGVGLLGDMVQARPMKESIKDRLKEVGGNLKRKADEKIDKIMDGSGYKVKRLNHQHSFLNKTSKRRVVKQNQSVRDIFSN